MLTRPPHTLSRVCSAGGGAKRKASPGSSPSTLKKQRDDPAHPPRDVNSALLFQSSSSSNPSPGYMYQGKHMWRIYLDVMLPPHKGIVPAIPDKRQARLAIEKIVLCYSAMATDREHALVVDDAYDKGDREKLVKELDTRLARCFKQLYTEYADNVPRSVKQWLDQRVIMRAPDVVWVGDVCPHAPGTHCLSLTGHLILHHREPLGRPRQVSILSQRPFRARQTQRHFCGSSGQPT